MAGLNERVRAIPAECLQAMARGIEKESLRTDASGHLALTPHPGALGSALTNPHITTDFSESQPELVTGVHTSVEGSLAELTRIHQFVYRHLGDERLWVSSMPGLLPDEAGIPIGQYGSSNVGRAKTVYRNGLAHRYGKRMQTISGIHYNWSMPGLSNEQYFALIRNFRRHSFLLLLLFGASPAVPAAFVAGLTHGLQPLGEHTLYLPHATSLRMGRLGYQSDAQSQLSVSYNGLTGYAASLQDALTEPYPPYEAIGIQDERGQYRQLSTSLLQIENEFYSTIRPKRVIRSGERPLHALRERGVEYVEVRCMDLNPFLSIGIDGDTARFIDIFLLHCLLSDSPLDSPEEVAALARNQQLTASRGREPGLSLERGAERVALLDWAAELVAQCEDIAQAVDGALGSEGYRQAWARAQTGVAQPDTLPSARVVSEMQALAARGEGGHVEWARQRSAQVRDTLLTQPLSDAELQRIERQALESLQKQALLEATAQLPFEAFRQEYVSASHLVV